MLPADAELRTIHKNKAINPSAAAPKKQRRLYENIPATGKLSQRTI
jgi:hypothetical protein